MKPRPVKEILAEKVKKLFRQVLKKELPERVNGLKVNLIFSSNMTNHLSYVLFEEKSNSLFPEIEKAYNVKVLFSVRALSKGKVGEKGEVYYFLSKFDLKPYKFPAWKYILLHTLAHVFARLYTEAGIECKAVHDLKNSKRWNQEIEQSIKQEHGKFFQNILLLLLLRYGQRG